MREGGGRGIESERGEVERRNTGKSDCNIGKKNGTASFRGKGVQRPEALFHLST